MQINTVWQMISSFRWFWLPLVNICLVIFLAYIANKIKEKIFNKINTRLQLAKNNTVINAFFYALTTPLTAFIWLMAINIAFHIVEIYLNKPLITELVEDITKVLVILLLVWLGNRFISRIENQVLEYRWQHIKVDRTSTLAIGKLSRVLIYLSGALIVLPTMGIPISGVLALGGVGGIAVGFAAKEMVSNLLGGMMLYVERPFSVNDTIELPEKHITGKISDIGWRTTKIRLADGRVMFVPNSTFAVTNVINETKRSHFRIYETLKLRYSDVTLLPKIVKELKDMLEQHSAVNKHDIIQVSLIEFGDSALNCLIWCFVNKTNKQEYLVVLEDILLKAHHIITANQAEIAYATPFVIQGNK